MLKITAFLKDGRFSSIDGLINIDTLLYVAMMKKEFPEMFGASFNYDDQKVLPLPLKIMNKNEDNWYYDCSTALFKIYDIEMHTFNKRLENLQTEKYVDFKKKKEQVETQKGKFKNYRISQKVILTPKIEWHVNSTDKDLIIELLSYIDFIGKKPSQGYGKIKKWLVEETEDNLTHLRPVPNLKGNVETAIRPLYHNPNNVFLCNIPDDERIGYNGIFKR